jgi:hypothetical protein
VPQCRNSSFGVKLAAYSRDDGYYADWKRSRTIPSNIENWKESHGLVPHRRRTDVTQSSSASSSSSWTGGSIDVISTIGLPNFVTFDRDPAHEPGHQVVRATDAPS